MPGQPLVPRLTVVIILYNMCREAARSLYSLSTAYQVGVCAEEYEVIVVDNGSDQPLTQDQVAAFGPNFRYLPIPANQAHPSPCAAINQAVDMARAPNVGVMIDGARIVTPGVIAAALDVLKRYDRAVVATIGFHLGPAMQTWAAVTGYNQAIEDGLLGGISWPENGYKLFDIGSLTGTNWTGWLGPMTESNLIFLSRDMYREAGGFDERLDLPGGELANLDFYNRVSELEGSTLISLFGEATFHQIHGGAMSSHPGEKIREEIGRYMERYKKITGEPFRFSARVPLLVGTPREESFSCLTESCRTDRVRPSEKPVKLSKTAVCEGG